MKHHMMGKVVGVELVEPDPKAMPGFEAARVKVQFTTSLAVPDSTFSLTVRSTGTLIVPLEHVGHRGDFALGRTVTADFEDYQQDLFARGERAAKKLGEDLAALRPAVRSLVEREGEFFDANTGEQVEGGELRDPDMEVSIQFGTDAPIRSTVGQMRKALDQIKAKRGRANPKHN